ncbi:hypothetical protein EUGRSUZ_H00772 [Eucalyptus grandis]|uniref:Uncharacterized protein n=2 Tax=Eucalyptus grandis TaxID=71139 RepID=A0ACC3JMB0_EUCGR|nr:hypothetical protein EUGRSUZ_H00772 [Eucalyptus grandis]
MMDATPHQTRRFLFRPEMKERFSGRATPRRAHSNGRGRAVTSQVAAATGEQCLKSVFHVDWVFICGFGSERSGGSCVCSGI